MLSGSLYILLGFISVVGGIIQFFRKGPYTLFQSIILIFFIASHLCLGVIGLYMWGSLFHLSVVILAGLIILISRYLNGCFLFKKVHGRHYFIVAGIITLGACLYPY
ncbi:uncharacterized membrane protein (UPF0136 family) [Pullulanibacillus pueri]|uniref:hypothetical protein n=1 Tax=Pullulanibacillus pueri TaxID=1437324 RepID=UPI00166C6D5B|nr:hypothetical protein [Pullulanibacillus pueri]MBM7683194.1 uncharacterized membrane protein (UPF0136 family) [Pullulanibacillus pueri]